MSDYRGLPVISDFDGTITHLGVDWSAVRERVGVCRIAELWTRPDAATAWEIVAEAEINAAHHCALNDEVASWLTASSGYAVLTNNSELAVAAFLGRHPVLESQCRLVIGRETLAGSKEDGARFESAVHRARTALGIDEMSQVRYIGDQDYELAAAAALGMVACRVQFRGRQGADPGVIEDE